MNYGLIKHEHLEDIAFSVCECLGHGENDRAYEMIMETAHAETGAGTIIDLTKGAGMGITQIDELPFQDIKDRCRDVDKNRISKNFGIDIDLVQWEHLRYNPLLCMIFTRLKYKKIPEPIPILKHDRAIYWKQHYNTEAGKGTIEHYLEMNR